MNNQETTNAIHQRLPAHETIRCVEILRATGESWSEIEDRLDGVSSEIAQTNVPYAAEAEKFHRRVLQATYAIETRCN